jgi:hypothetical protein
MLAQRAPNNVVIGRGFVITDSGPTTQCDILIYRADLPVLFRQGDLAFVTPDAVVGIIEVKSRATSQVVDEGLGKLAALGRKLGRHREHCCLGLFIYEAETINHELILTKLQNECQHRSQIVNFINIGCSAFIRFWEYSPNGGDENYEQWHSYDLENMSAGYFLSNVLDFISPESIARNSKLWFPEDSKEFRLVAKRSHAAAPN